LSYFSSKNNENQQTAQLKHSGIHFSFALCCHCLDRAAVSKARTCLATPQPGVGCWCGILHCTPIVRVMQNKQILSQAFCCSRLGMCLASSWTMADLLSVQING